VTLLFSAVALGVLRAVLIAPAFSSVLASLIVFFLRLRKRERKTLKLKRSS
jgi:hypothetical protein